MCYSVYFSTDSGDDFSLSQAKGLNIRNLDPAYDAKNEKFLRYPRRWIVASEEACCSCHFRHAIDWPEFVPLQDWYPEDEDDVEATGHFYDFIQSILKAGWKLDIVDIWEGYAEATIPTFEVALSSVPRDHFRFFQDARFEVSV